MKTLPLIIIFLLFEAVKQFSNGIHFERKGEGEISNNIWINSTVGIELKTKDKK